MAVVKGHVGKIHPERAANTDRANSRANPRLTGREEHGRGPGPRDDRCHLEGEKRDASAAKIDGIGRRNEARQREVLGEVAETPGTILSEEDAPRRNGQTAFEGSNGRLLKGLKGP